MRVQQRRDGKNVGLRTSRWLSRRFRPMTMTQGVRDYAARLHQLPGLMGAERHAVVPSFRLAPYGVNCYDEAIQTGAENMSGYLDRITTDPDIFGGRPCIRGMRVRVKDILDMLAGGATPRRNPR